MKIIKTFKQFFKICDREEKGYKCEGEQCVCNDENLKYQSKVLNYFRNN